MKKIHPYSLKTVLLLVLTSVLTLMANSARADPPLPGEFRRGLAFIPVDAESLMATLKPFAVPKLSQDVKNIVSFEHSIRFAFVGSGLTPKSGSRLTSLEGREVDWAMFAKRAQDVKIVPGTRIIELGVHPYESISIAKFREPLPPAFLEDVRGSMQSENRSGVQVFRSKTEPFAILIPKPDLLVSISMLSANDAMLDDVIQRVVTKPSDFLFQGEDVAWSLSNLESSIWGLRKTKNDRGRHQDANGRDWVLSTIDAEKSQSALFRSILSAGRQVTNGNPWLSFTDQETTRKDLGLVARIKVMPRYIDTTLECLPEFRDRCLSLPFLIEALGIMIWM